MCIYRPVRWRTEECIGYCIVKKHSSFDTGPTYSPFYFISKEDEFLPGVIYKAEPHLRRTNYYGFHAFFTFDDAQNHARRSIFITIPNHICIVKCMFYETMAQGINASTTAPVFKAKFRKILCEVNIKTGKEIPL